MPLSSCLYPFLLLYPLLLLNRLTVFHSKDIGWSTLLILQCGHVDCFQSSVGTNKAAVTERVTTFSIPQMPRESHDAKWNCFKCQQAYAFVILINSAKLPSREVVAIYTFTNNVWKRLFLHIPANAVLPNFRFFANVVGEEWKLTEVLIFNFQKFQFALLCNEWIFLYVEMPYVFSKYCLFIFLSFSTGSLVILLFIKKRDSMTNGNFFFLVSYFSLWLCLCYHLKSSFLFHSSFVLGALLGSYKIIALDLVLWLV